MIGHISVPISVPLDSFMFFCFFADLVSRRRDIFARAFYGVAPAQERGGANDQNQAREGDGEVVTHNGLSAAHGGRRRTTRNTAPPNHNYCMRITFPANVRLAQPG